ncbi:MAG: methyltransferase domain-containing protein [Dehalococcoidia bacterium]|nr:methyltransferase domain-containing protein [Dehalococcoidia bacterium]
MDIWKYYAVTHADHLVCNPTSEAKLEELVNLLPLQSGARVLDIACGKAELLIRIADHHDASGVGVDISSYETEVARQRVAERRLDDRVEIVLMGGADYDAAPGSFDLAMCIGATWVWDGYVGTIEALKKIAKPGGLIAIGEPFKMHEPSAEYENAEPGLVANLVTHAENVAIAVNAGLTPLYAIVSSQDDWDRYEGLQWRAAEAFAVENPDDPDLPELLARMRENRTVYLRHARDTLNWAIYLFRAPG